MKEIWKPVFGFEGLHEVSNRGRVRVLFSGNHGHYKPGRILSPVPHKNKYLFVALYKPGVIRHEKVRSIHSLVLEAFHGPRPKGMVSRHLDGNRTNNTPENLAWGTKKQNYADSRVHGTNCQGTRNGFSVLTDDDVVKMKKLRAEGKTYKALGAIFGTHWSNAWLIIKGKTWRHVSTA